MAADPNIGFLVAIGVDSASHVWLSYFAEENSLMEQRDAGGAATGVKIKTTNPGQQGEERMNAINFAFDSHENLYYGDGNTGSPVAEFVFRRDADTNYVPRHTINDGTSRGLAIDPSTDALYVNHGTSITGNHYTEKVETAPPFETLPGLNATGMDFSADGQTLFVGEGAKVDIFKRQPPEIPSAVGPLSFEGVKSQGDVRLRLDRHRRRGTNHLRLRIRHRRRIQSEQRRVQPHLSGTRLQRSPHQLRPGDVHQLYRRVRTVDDVPRAARGEQRHRDRLLAPTR